MIDSNGGVVRIGALTVGPRSRPSLLSECEGVAAEMVVKNGPLETWRVRVGGDYAALLIFKNEVLREIHLSVDDSGSWSEWSEIGELKKKKTHDALLARDLGAPPYEFSWGSVTSSYEPRTGASQIIIHYV